MNTTENNIKTLDQVMPKGEDFSGDAGAGDFTDMVDRKEAIAAAVSFTKDILDEVMKMYVEDGNPELWMNKIQKLKDSIQ